MENIECVGGFAFVLHCMHTGWVFSSVVYLIAMNIFRSSLHSMSHDNLWIFQQLQCNVYFFCSFLLLSAMRLRVISQPMNNQSRIIALHCSKSLNVLVFNSFFWVFEIKYWSVATQFINSEKFENFNKAQLKSSKCCSAFCFLLIHIYWNSNACSQLQPTCYWIFTIIIGNCTKPLSVLISEIFNCVQGHMHSVYDINFLRLTCRRWNF